MTPHEPPNYRKSVCCLDCKFCDDDDGILFCKKYLIVVDYEHFCDDYESEAGEGGYVVPWCSDGVAYNTTERNKP